MSMIGRRCLLARGAVVAVGLLVLVCRSAVAAPEAKIVSIEVKGNVHISSEAVLSAATRTKIGAPISQQSLAEDERDILRLGFFHEVHALTEPVADGVKVIFAVVEHPKITEIKFSGNSKIPESELRKLLTLKPGDVFNERVFQNDASAIQKHYAQAGYTLARVTQDSQITPEGVLTFVIAEAWVEAIKVVGNQKTKTRVILREMDTKPGDVYNHPRFLEDLRRLYNLDFFEPGGLVPEYEPGSEEGKVVLILNVKEKKTGTVAVGLGYSSRDRLVGFANITEHNFRGTGQQIGFNWEAGQFTNRSGYELSFMDPWMLGKRTSLGVQLYNRALNRPQWLVLPAPASGAAGLPGGQEVWFAERRAGGTVSVGKPLGKKSRLLLDFRSDSVRATPVADETLEQNQKDYLAQWLSENDGRVTSITLRGIRNTRDVDVNPTSGSLYSSSVELGGGPLGGRWTFAKMGVDLRRYFPVGRAKPDGSNQKVLAMRLMAGATLGKIALVENYWIGGAETLRGYREDQFYGTRTLLFSTEFRVPFGTSLQGVAFTDAGYAWPRGTDVRLSDLKTSVGVGLRVVTPLGPLRLDYGYGEDGGRTHFSIGHVF